VSAIILKSGEYYEPEQSFLMDLQRAYPNCNVYDEVNAMRMWCECNPAKRKTARGIKRFINSWLSRANGRGGSPMVGQKRERIATRDIPLNDMLNDKSWA
jgi:hypothetical protein